MSSSVRDSNGRREVVQRVEVPNQSLHVTGHLRLIGHMKSSGPHVNWVVRVRHLTFVQIALKELHHDNGVRVEQPALLRGTG
jgi:hypothetical protein